MSAKRILIVDDNPQAARALELAAALRREPGQRSMRVISMSGASREGDFLRALESGVDQHLSKPLEMRFLRSLLGPRG